MNDLIILIIKNLKYKPSNKKLFHKFINFFQIVDKIKTQIYRLFYLSLIKFITFFYMFLLKSYYNRDCDDASKSFIQVFKLIDNNEP